MPDPEETVKFMLRYRHEFPGGYNLTAYAKEKPKGTTVGELVDAQESWPSRVQVNSDGKTFDVSPLEMYRVQVENEDLITLTWGKRP